MGKKNIKKIIIPLISVLIVIYTSFGLMKYIGAPQFDDVRDVVQLSFHNTGVIYFGDDHSKTSGDIKTIVSTVAQTTKIKTLYLPCDNPETEYGLSQKEFKKLLDNYGVEQVPALVAVCRREVRDSIVFDDTADAALMGNEISNFYNQASTYLNHNNPYDYADLILFAAALILFNLSFLSKPREAHFLLIFVCNIGLIALVLYSFKMAAFYSEMMPAAEDNPMIYMGFAALILSFISTVAIFVRMFKKE